MAKKGRKPKKEKITVGALGEDLKTNKPIVDMVGADSGKEPENIVVPVEPKIDRPRPLSWPFIKGNVANERAELEHIARRINQKYDNPGAKTITKTVIFNCQDRSIECKDYEIAY